MTYGHHLGRDLSKKEEQWYHDENVQPLVLCSEHAYQYSGRDDGRGHIDQLITDQDGNDEPSRLAQETLDDGDSRVLVPPHLLELNIAEGEK